MANSTVMFSGINPEGRNSSKVLRPPGGGSSLGPFHCDQPEEARATKQEAAAPPAEPVAEQVREERGIFILRTLLCECTYTSLSLALLYARD